MLSSLSASAIAAAAWVMLVAQISVANAPGSSIVVRMCDRCSSVRRLSAIASSACLLAQYAALPAVGSRPFIDDVTTMRDGDAELAPSRSSGRKACVRRTTASVLTSS